MGRQKVIGITVVIILFLVSAVILSSGCYNDNEARVTIHLERNDLAFQKNRIQKGFIDRVLAFFSTPAEAVSVDPWTDVHGDLTLVISSSEFETKIFSLTADTTVFTAIIPAVSGVNFTITSEYLGIKNWGGHKTLDISPGEQDLVLKMIPMTYFYDSGAGNWMIWNPISPVQSNSDSYIIYRSDSPDGPFTELVKISNIATGYYEDTFNLIMDNTYYYKIAVSGSDGDGVLSDPRTILYNP